jgi:hypothetical protein
MHTLSMILAQQRAVDLLKAARRQRHATFREGEPIERVGSAFRLQNGSWVFGRHDS